MVLDFKFRVTPPDSIVVDLTRDVENCSLVWPATDTVPSLTVQLNNETGKYARGPLWSQMAVTLPNGLGTYNFALETSEPQGDRNQGHYVKLTGRGATELLFLTEGNLQVVGTDIPVYEFNAGPGGPNANVSYVPYPSSFVSNLNSNLLDVGNLLTALIHTQQPNQASAYRGRLGYDMTGLGILSATGIDYTIGASTNFNTKGAYMKGMWQVGQGSTGAQKTGVDLIKDALTKNLIDNTGAPVFLDYYVDVTATPKPLIVVFPRGSQPASGIQTFTLGTDMIEDIDLPVDTQDAKNFVILWENAESAYPTGGDAWSNYQNTTQLQAQWQLATGQVGLPNSSNATMTNSAVGYAAGSSSIRIDPTSAGTGLVAVMEFNLLTNWYHALSQAFLMGLSAFNFRLYNNNNGTAPLTVTVYLFDDFSNNIIGYTFPGGIPGLGWNNMTIAIPASGLGVWSQVSAGTGWNWATNYVTRLEIVINEGGQTGLTSDYYLTDFINFTDNWQFSPVFSYGGIGTAGATYLLNALSSTGQTAFGVYSFVGWVVGQPVILGLGTANQEIVTVTGFNVVMGSPVVLCTATAKTHAANDIVSGATHNANSMAAYGMRIYSYVDFYANNVGSDQASAIANALIQQRMGKKSTGKFKVWGYSPQVPYIKPGYVFQFVNNPSFTDLKDVYVGNATVDSVIYGWIADTVQYDIDRNQGFYVTYTVEPYYQTLVAASPDTVPKNPWRSRTAAQLISRLYRTSQRFGTQK